MLRTQKKPMLRAAIINNTPIIENNDPLIEINQALFPLDPKSFANKPALIRSSVHQKLIQAKAHLAENLTFKIYDAYRSLAEQTESWNKRLKETRAENPNLEETELIRRTKLKVANPTQGGFGGHQTGGAIDLTLIDENGQELEMGTTIGGHTPKTPTHNNHVTAQEKANRALLLNALEKEDFVNFPGEWWHFCYGDRMWAAYRKEPNAIYGLIKEATTKTQATQPPKSPERPS